MTEQAVEIIIQVKCGDMSKDRTEALTTVDLLSKLHKNQPGFRANDDGNEPRSS